MPVRRLFLSSLVTNVLARVIHIITGVLGARLLGPYGKGELALASRWSGLFVLLFTIGLPGALMLFGKQEAERQREFFGAYLILASFVGFIGLVTGELMLPVLLRNQASTIVGVAQIAMLAIPLGVVADGLSAMLQTINNFSRVMLVRIVGEVGTLLLIGALIFTGRYDVRTFIIGNTFVSSLGFALTLLLTLRLITPSWKNVMRNSVVLLKRGIRIYIGTITGVMGGNIDQLVLSLFLTPYALGLYAVGANIGGMLTAVLSGTIGMYLWPKLLDTPAEERLHRVEEVHSALLYGSLALAVVGSILIPVFLPEIYGFQYEGAVRLTEILIFTAPINMAYLALTYLHSSIDRFGVITVAELAGLVVGVAVTFSLVHGLEGIGAAVGVFSATVAKWVVAAFPAIRAGVSWRSLFRVRLDDFTRNSLHVQRLVRIPMGHLSRWVKR